MQSTVLCLIAEEILELTDQISRGGKTIYELQRLRKILHVEKSDIRAALEEAEVAGNVCVWACIYTHTDRQTVTDCVSLYQPGLPGTRGEQNLKIPGRAATDTD